MKRFRHYLEKLYYIPYCSVCDSAVTPPLPSPFICRDCLSQLPFRLGKEEVLWAGDFPVYASLFYRDPIPRMVVRMKFSDRSDHARALAPLLARTIRRHALFADALIPVPLHRKRKAERSYNQAELIARALSLELAVPVVEDLLYRGIHTPPQSASTTVKERFMHLKEAFALHSEHPVNRELSGRHVLLLDDVLTTGATMAWAAAPLLQAGIKVTGIVVASDRDRYDGYREAFEAYF